MNLCRFENPAHDVCAGLVLDDGNILELSSAPGALSALLEEENLSNVLAALAQKPLPRHPAAAVRLLAPVGQQEVWAAGVTYQISRFERMRESEMAADVYARVYDAYDWVFEAETDLQGIEKEMPPVCDDETVWVRGASG